MQTLRLFIIIITIFFFFFLAYLYFHLRSKCMLPVFFSGKTFWKTDIVFPCSTFGSPCKNNQRLRSTTKKKLLQWKAKVFLGKTLTMTLKGLRRWPTYFWCIFDGMF